MIEYWNKQNGNSFGKPNIMTRKPKFNPKINITLRHAVICGFLLQTSLEWSVTCLKVGVWTPAPRPSTTPRRGAASRARTTVGSAPAPATASSLTPPTTSLMEPVWSWSVEKVNKVTVVFKKFRCCRFFPRIFCVTRRHGWPWKAQSQTCPASALCWPPLSDCFSHRIFDPLPNLVPFFSQGRWRIQITTAAWPARRAAASVSCVSQAAAAATVHISQKWALPTDRTFTPACCQPCSRVFPGGSFF